MPPEDDSKQSDPWAALNEPVKEVRPPSLLENLFHCFMLGLSGLIVFAISGALLVMALAKSSVQPWAKEPTMAAVERAFITGGLIGLGSVIKLYCTKLRRDKI